MYLRQLHRRSWFAALLALSLVLSQALWLLHRVAHSGVGAHSQVHGAAHEVVRFEVHAAVQAAGHAHGHTSSQAIPDAVPHTTPHTNPNTSPHAAPGTSTWAKLLLPEHSDERSCAHFDQLSHSDMVLGCSQPLGLSQAHAVATPATHVASSLAAQAAGFLARGPPANA